MNRADVFATYEVGSTSKTIVSPGKFEGEMLYVPAFWDRAMAGEADVDEGNVYGFIFVGDDRLDFPEIGTSYGILMEESETGFVHGTEFATRAKFEYAVELLERDYDEYETDEDDE